MATLLKVLNNLADIKSAGVLHFASELRGEVRIVKGPHYQYTSVKIRDAMTVQRGGFSRFDPG
jgi:hypothetical protein